MKFNLYLRSIRYSTRLILQSSGAFIFLYLALSLLGVSFSLFQNYLIKLILDGLTVHYSGIEMSFFWIALYALILILAYATNSSSQIVQDSVIAKAEHCYDLNLADRLSELPLSFLDSSNGRDMVEDVRYTRSTAVYTVFRVIWVMTYAYSFLIAFGTLAHFNFWFSLLLLVLVMPGVILREYFERAADSLRRRLAPDSRKFSYYRWMLTDAWPAKDVRTYNLTDPIKSRYQEEKDKYISANRRLDKKKAITMILAELLRRSGEISFTVFVVYEAIKGNISVGEVALYIGFSMTVSNAFESMLFQIVYGYDMISIRMSRLFEFNNVKSDVRADATTPLKELESLTFDNVYFKYPYTDTYILRGVSFTLNKGDKLSIVGINGSGKSTIIKLMLGLYPVESGQILINGLPMSDYDIHDVRMLFSVLFQNFVQYPLSLRENIALSSPNRIQNDDEIDSVLKQSGVYEEILPKLRNGLDSFMTRQFDDNGTELSLGQWQKVALSRTYFKNAPVVIFDEPSASLDAEAEDKIFRNFEKISGGKTGIMISHRISSARISDKIVVLDDGKIAEQGTHNELICANGLYSKLYNLQREKYAQKAVE